MPKSKYERLTGQATFIRTWLTGHEDQIEEAFRKEASRQVGEMERWMKDQAKFDPVGMLWHYEEEFFPLIEKALKYRAKIYNRNKLIAKVKFKVIEANAKGETDKSRELVEDWLRIVDEQMVFVWRIKRIHAKVTREIRLELDQGEEDPFEEYVYDPAKS